MKRSSDSDSELSSDDEYEEEPRIHDVLKQLSGAVNEQDARDLLHSMAASKDILFWSPNGEIIRNKRRIPETSVVDLLEFVLLPHNKDVSSPRALKSFLNGLAQLQVNKRLIRNKIALNDVIGLENIKDHLEQERSDDEETSSDENSSDKESTSDEDDPADQEGGGIETTMREPCFHCSGNNVFRSDIAECPVCYWRDVIRGGYDQNKRHICPICQSVSRLESVSKETFQRCNTCNARMYFNHVKNRVKTFIPDKPCDPEIDYFNYRIDV